MKGSHKVIVETERMKYEFTIRRNITVILGDSGTGKTTLVEFLNMYSRRGKGSGVTVQSDVPCVVFSAVSGLWRPILEEISHSIIFIDEGQPFIFSTDFAEVVQHSDNYFVLITRRPLRNLPYSTKEIYAIRTTGKYHFPEKVYQEFYPIYETVYPDPLEKKTILLLEDSNAGYDFFRKAFPKTSCISAGGNAAIAGKLGSMEIDHPVIVIADGAAFGAYIESILSIREVHKDISIYLPESFEWLILRSGIIGKTGIREIIEHPEDYIDSALYFSWERFFTEILEKETSDDIKIHYRKEHLADYYLSSRSIHAILDVLPGEIRNYLRQKSTE